MSKIISLLCILAGIIIAGFAIYRSFIAPTDDIVVDPGKIEKIETIAQLCTIDLYEEVPVCDTINGKVIFAIQKQQGSISFDLEKLEVDASADTVRIILSPEIIDIYESTDDNSWEVIDRKSLAALGSSNFTLEEENAVKRKIKDKTRRRLYKNGTIKRARQEGARNLQSLMEKVYRKPVVVVDPTPNGTPR